MPSLLAIFVFFSLSFYICNGRLLNIGHDVDDKNSSKISPHDSTKGAEETRDANATIPPVTMQLMAEEQRSDRKVPAREGPTDETEDGDSAGMEDDLDASTMASGYAEAPHSSSHVALLGSAKFKGSWGSGELFRSLLGQGSGDETPSPNQARLVADVLAMDYSKPGGSSPIHNR